MRKDVARHFLETGEGFTTNYDFHKLSEYLQVIPDAVVAQCPHLERLVIRQLTSAKNIVLQELPKLNDSREDLYFSEEIEIGDMILPERNVLNYFQLAEIKYLKTEIDKYKEESIKFRATMLEHQREILTAILPLIEFLLKNPIPVSIKTSRLMSPADRTAYVYQKPVMKRLLGIRRYTNQLYLQVQLIPPPFRSKHLNRDYLNKFLDLGEQQKKTGTTYFPELPNEDFLHTFFSQPAFPLGKEGIFPISEEEEMTPEFIKKWIDDATVCIAAFVLTEDLDRADLIAIILERFLFSVTYPKLFPEPTEEAKRKDLEKKMMKFSQKTPREIGINLSYVMEGYEDRPVTDLFNIDNISRAPLDWLAEMDFHVCPIDSAFCLAKAHEALSMMCVLRKAKASHPSEVSDFMEKMPGFDDIFEMWLALLSVSGLPDPFRTLHNLDKYSKLPGFTGRLLSSIAYLEASIMQLAQGEE